MKSLILILAGTAVLASGIASADENEVAAGSRRAAHAYTYGSVTTQVIVASVGLGVMVGTLALVSKTHGTSTTGTTGTTGTH